MRDIFVIYHDCCIDGLASAWAVDRQLGGTPHANIRYIPYAHHDFARAEREILEQTGPNATLIFVDVAPRREFLDILVTPDSSGQGRAGKISVMDHHKSAAENLSGYSIPPVKGFAPPDLGIDIDENSPSAALMIWEKIFPDTPAPAFLRMIAKMDLGEGLKDEQDFAAAALIDAQDFSSVPQAFFSFRNLSAFDEEEMAVMGERIHADHLRKIEKLSDNVMYAPLKVSEHLPEIWIPVVNADVQNFGRRISEYLREIGKQAGTDVAFAWYVQGNGTVTMSIRSDGTPDASEIAGHFRIKCGATGGGHATSAAVHFSSLQEFCMHLPLHAKERALLRKKPPSP